MKSLQFGSTFFLSFFSIFCCLEFGETQLVVIVNHHHPLCRFRSRSSFFNQGRVKGQTESGFS
jgi:hypothetical protein